MIPEKKESNSFNVLEKKSKKIMIVSDRIYPFYLGGYETMFFEYSKRLINKYNIFWLTTIPSKNVGEFIKNLPANENEILKKITFIPIKSNTSYTNKKDVHSIFGILKYNLLLFFNRKKIDGYDAYIFNTIPYFGISSHIRNIKKKKGIVISLFNEAWYNYPDKGFIGKIERMVLRRAIRSIVKNSNYIIAVSQPTANSLIYNYKVKREKVAIIPNGLSKIITPNFQEFKKYDIAFVGRFASIKRIDDIIKATKILSDEGILLKVLLIGDGPLAKNLKQMTTAFHLENLINFAGIVKGEEKLKLLSLSRFFVMPSEREGFSLSTLEAMSLGVVPIVARPKYEELFGIGHYLKDGVNGLVYNVGNVLELANCIKKLYYDPDLTKRLSEAARKTALEFTWDRSAELLDNFLEEKLK